MYEDEFKDILTRNERVIWSDRPHILVHLASGLPLFIIGGFAGTAFGFLSIFMLFHLLPLWLGVGNMIRLIFVYRNTYFAYTDKRVIIKTGFMGVDYKTKEFFNIGNIEVNVNPLENILGLGTIRIDEEYVGSGKNSRRVGNRLYGIQNPYDIFRDLKEIVTDIKTDISYPNEYRPETNKGYNTKYDR
mgnify:CR=1 FL=1